MLISPSPTASLAFANTRYWRGTDTPTEELGDMPAIINWVGKNAVLEDHIRDQLNSYDEDETEMLEDEIIILRESMYRVFAAVASAKSPARDDVKELQRHIADVTPRSDLVRTESGFAWNVLTTIPCVSEMLAPVLWSAGDILVGETSKRLRLCSNEKCLYLFLDNSRSGARRWCDMKACGNRAKAHRHYLKSKAA